ncbi:hypothetical protein GCM10009332_05700 [Shewanella gelidii]|uniref:GGDEF domain-containing protein n=2 Tax=Shewanella gelidii TaxID=1642821 RepID=A0A917JIR5_9GAMM|nr:hypothetical protein GCM10009332_05700 [Shewanella gelidii]
MTMTCPFESHNFKQFSIRTVRVIALSWLLLCFFSVQALAAQVIDKVSPEVLIINSYHKGYVWSDEVTSGIESAIYHTFPNAKISIEYMDTKRNTSPTYMGKLTSLYQEKFAHEHYDLIVASDDNAINLIRDHHLFPSTIPVVYSGTHEIIIDEKNNAGNVTGVKEHLDIQATLELAKTLQSNIKKVVVINDKSTTGRLASTLFEELIAELEQPFEYIQLEDEPLATIEDQIADLEDDTIVLLLAYIRDNQGVYYPPEVTASRLSQASSVPIYSVWDFFFNHGILGGQVTSGYLHGEAAGDMAVEILLGADPSDIAIENEGGNQMLVDYRQLQRFNLSISDVPKNAVVKNINYSSDRNVLMLLSYSYEDKWSQSIVEGVRHTFSKSDQNIKVSTEFMDTKRYNDKSYINDLLLLYKNKYQQQELDVVMVADDNAFQFAQRYRNVLFPGVPIVFCGVNYLQDPKKMSLADITGVTESYDILGTINMGLTLFPQTRKLYVINDQTTSGRANSLKLAKVKPRLPKSLEVFEIGAKSMQQLLHEVAKLDDDTLILLMSFTTDKNNHRFSYESSIRMLHQKANRPILGFWDFYAGEGIVAGVVTSGFDQGRTAGSMALRILGGQSAANIPVMTRSPVQPTIDEAQLLRFVKKEVEYQPDVKVLNQNIDFFERYQKYIIAVTLVILVLLVLIVSQWFKIQLQNRFNQRLSVKAVTDGLTGAKTRSYFEKYLRQAMRQCVQRRLPLCLCYIDLDGLKHVNDDFGHAEGDKYINHVVQAIKTHIRAEDEVCRVGGDEFVVVFKGCEQDKVTTLCQLINSELQLMAKDKSLPYEMRVSCGISSLDLDSPQPADVLVAKADSDMYHAKRRNQT